ncbi:amidohydrolase family protein [Phenylobacterium sp. SCN 70-31]|uniref:amidohydrolase family protein n=1 Tax=Phenylobacterium sp. SCN 70-31 TaxID=1660129 RepID=UPI00086894EA|nr:amidohydrolase family protein [Phenylobacterium sp. SCN 70-31]ODT89926.1 MAG: amidohydrolase [Phenylobacterium sp. SCN 70-31]
MPYVENEIIHDADAHIVELPDCLDDYIEPRLKDAYHAARNAEPEYAARMLGREALIREKLSAKHADPEFRAGAAENLMSRKGHESLGGFLAEDRPQALDLLGFATQLMFTSIALRNFNLDTGDDMDLCYGAARAHNRMITDFCSVDRRMLPVAYIPIADMERAPEEARFALELGAKGFMIPQQPPKTHSPSHTGLDPLWAIAQEAGVPILFHINGTDLNPSYRENGKPNVVIVSGDGDSNSLGYMSIPQPVQTTLAALIFDGVMDRFENLKFGAIELGASWVPSWLRLMDNSFEAFARHEERLRNLSARPSEIARRQVRVTPFPTDDVSWIIQNSAEEICMFSSDYPHVEGGRNPLKRFRENLVGSSLSQRAIDGFFRDNYIDMMGKALPEDLRYPKHLVAA